MSFLPPFISRLYVIRLLSGHELLSLWDKPSYIVYLDRTNVGSMIDPVSDRRRL